MDLRASWQVSNGNSEAETEELETASRVAVNRDPGAPSAVSPAQVLPAHRHELIKHRTHLLITVPGDQKLEELAG